MSTIRLTNEMRDATVKALLGHRFDEEERKLCAEVEEWGRRVFIHLMGDDLEAVRQAPSKWFEQKTGLEVHIRGLRGLFGSRYNDETKGRSVCLRNIAYEDWPITFSASVSVPRFLREVTPAIDMHGPLGIEAQDFNVRAHKLREARKELHEKTRAVLNVFTTVAKLTEAWPDVTKFLPTEVKPKPQVPAVPVAELNAAFRLEAAA